MLQNIINNFEKECEINPDDMMVRIVCNHVTEKLSKQPEEVLKNIIDSKLTIKGAIETIRKEAEKKRTGNYAVLSDAEGFKIADKYFGILDREPQEVKSLFDLI